MTPSLKDNNGDDVAVGGSGHLEDFGCHNAIIEEAEEEHVNCLCLDDEENTVLEKMKIHRAHRHYHHYYHCHCYYHSF